MSSFMFTCLTWKISQGKKLERARPCKLHAPSHPPGACLSVRHIASNCLIVKDNGVADGIELCYNFCYKPLGDIEHRVRCHAPGSLPTCVQMNMYALQCNAELCFNVTY